MTEFPLVGSKIFEMVEKWWETYEKLTKNDKQSKGENLL